MIKYMSLLQKSFLKAAPFLSSGHPSPGGGRTHLYRACEAANTVEQQVPLPPLGERD